MNVVPSTTEPDDAALQAMWQAGYAAAIQETITARVRLGEERAALDRQRADLQNQAELVNARHAELLDARRPDTTPTWARARHPTWEEQVAARRAALDRHAAEHYASTGRTEFHGLARHGRRAA